MAKIGFLLHPEIISIHIPKTAGSSFHGILAEHYGWRLKHIQKAADIKTWSTGKKYYANKPFVKAIHGHIRPHENWKRFYPNAKWVCWLRDPAERVLSAYKHLEKTEHLGDRNQALFAELQPDVESFVRLEAFKPVTRIYQRFLADFLPSDFAFAGRVEYFEKDLQIFANLIGAKALKSKMLNTAEGKKLAITDSLRSFLGDELVAEYQIYNTFLKAFHPWKLPISFLY